jgi:hypothetical protein
MVSTMRAYCPAQSQADGELTGLPVTGFAVIEYVNTDLSNVGGAAGVAANYQSAWEHKTSVATSSAN